MIIYIIHGIVSVFFPTSYTIFAFSLVYTIYRKKFKKEGMWGHAENLKTSVIGPQMELAWEKELEKDRIRQK